MKIAISFIIIVLLLPLAGCDSDSSEPVNEFQVINNLGADLFRLTSDVSISLGERMAQLENDTPEKNNMMTALTSAMGVQLFCNRPYLALRDFKYTTVKDGVFYGNNGSEATISGFIYAMEITYDIELDGKPLEKGKMNITYDSENTKWEITGFRGAAGNENWLRQEGVIKGGIYYIKTARYLKEEPDNTTWRDKMYLKQSGTTFIIGMIGDKCPGDCAGTWSPEIFQTGITEQSDEWPEFSSDITTPSYTLEP